MSEPCFDELKNLPVPESLTERALLIPTQPKPKRKLPLYAAAAGAAAVIVLAAALSLTFGGGNTERLPVKETHATKAVSAPVTEVTEHEELTAEDLTSVPLSSGVAAAALPEPEAAETHAEEPTGPQSVQRETQEMTALLTEPPTEVCAFTSATSQTGASVTQTEPFPQGGFYGAISLTCIPDGTRDSDEKVYCAVYDLDGKMAGGASEELFSEQHLTAQEVLSPDLPGAVRVMRYSYSPGQLGLSIEMGYYRAVFYYEDGGVLSDMTYELGRTNARPIKGSG